MLNKKLWIMMWMLLWAVVAWAAPAHLQVAGELLVDVSAADPSAGTATWINQGTLGDFEFITEFPVGSSTMTAGSPDANLVVETFAGVPVVRVLSSSSAVAAYRGPDAPASIIGGEDRTVEVWVADLKSALPKEQCLVAWGARGAGDGANCSVNFGYKEYGGWGLWSDDYDTGFGTPPSVGQLHHLVYVIDGNDALLYVDGALSNVHAMAGPLNTPEAPINLFIQNKLKDGALALDSKGLLMDVVINSIRIHSGALTADQVRNNYRVGPSRAAGLVVENPDQLMGFEPQMRDRLTSLGYLVQVVRGDDVKSGAFSVADAEALDLVVVSEAISSSDVVPLAGADVPMMNGEGYGWHKMNYAESDGSASWQDANQPATVVNDAHPIVIDANVALGPIDFLLDEKAKTTTASVSSLAPGAETLLSMNVDGVEYALVFAIDRGAELAKGAGPAANRIVGFSLPGNDDVNNVLSEAGWALFDAAIRWLDPAPQAVAGELLVDVSAADPSAGTATWVNQGTLGDFEFITEFPVGSSTMTAGSPDANLVVETFAGVPVVRVLSSPAGVAAYQGPNAPDTIIGGDDRTVEVWVADLKPELPKEQCLVAWGARGAGDGANCSVNLGWKSYGGWGLWSDDYDTGFVTPPSVGQLHHLVYVIDGNDALLYVDGVLDNVHTMAGPLSTPEAPINLFIQNKLKDGALALDSKGLLMDVVINSIRIHSGALRDDQIWNSYLVGPVR